MSTFAKGNPFSSFFGDPFFWDPFFSFFWFFLSPAKVGSLEMQPGAKLQAYLGVIILQPHACAQRFRLRILRRTRSNAGRTSAGSLSGRIESICKERDAAVRCLGTTTRALRSTCWPTRGRTWPPSARPGRKTVSWSRRCSWAACSEGSLGALPLPLGPCGDLRRHGAQHRHRPRWLPAPQLHRGLLDRASAQDAPQWRQRLFGRPGSVHLQGARRRDDGCVHPPDSLSAGDALWHRSPCLTSKDP